MEQQTPGFPPNFSRYPAVYYEKKLLRWESNHLCLLLIGIQIFIALLSWLFRQFVQGLGVLTVAVDAFNGFPPILYFLSHGVIYLLGLALPVFLYWGIRHISPVQALPFEKGSVGTSLLMVLFGAGVCTTANIPSSLVVAWERSMGYTGQVPDLPLNEDPLVQILFFFALAVIPPLTEELIFRGAILNGLRRFGDGFAIMGSAFLFAMYHGNFAQMVFAFPCGLVLAFAVVKTGNLWVAVLIHFLNNASAVVFQLMQFYTNEEIASIVYTIFFFTSAVLGLAAMIWLSLRNRKLFQLSPTESVLRPAQKFSAMILNPGCIALLLMSFVSAIYVLENY